MIGDQLLLNDGEVPLSYNRIDVAAELQLRIDRLKRDFYSNESGRVDYQALRDSQGFKDYCVCCRQLQEYDLLNLKTVPERTAFWINLYNSLIVHGIIALDIRQTVKDVYDFFGRIYYRIGIADYSADDIEHGILRGNRRPPYGLFHPFDEGDIRLDYRVEEVDPRIHFALVCGSSSCPPINYYAADKLEDQLEMAADNFINGAEVEILPEQNLLRLSPIFRWYKSDFGGQKGVLEALARYRKKPEDRIFLQEFGSKAHIEWKEYDWTLNS
ncbi:DUF547 domain-containing protein [Geopsychrobacter electrodiphilus]|uniref:DUF547 domain-containing protein n=1 Tax=Geopsychrobacter electrodiphilus TaxID=225196 RepID=UPI00035D3075|nr:DUF547 domain-containing protein [Geopsychrobacter electrodiphilus]